MRSKSGKRGEIDLTDLYAHSSDELAQFALDFVDRRDRFSSRPERRLAVAQVLATLSVQRAIQEQARSR